MFKGQQFKLQKQPTAVVSGLVFAQFNVVIHLVYDSTSTKYDVLSYTWTPQRELHVYALLPRTDS